MAGALFLVTLVAGVFAQGFVSERLVVAGDAARTAANIRAHLSLFRLGFAVYMIEMACQITMTVLFYSLLKPVSKTGSLIAAVIGLVGCTVKIVSRIFFFSPALVLGGAPYLSIFDAPQLQALAYLFLRFNYHAETMAMVFLGLYGIVKGYLVYRSTFLPRALGVLSAAGGLGWLTYLYEPLASRLLLVIFAVGFLGAAALIGWLLAFGVDERRWKDMADESATR
ncbi:MAG TPA: DUF4386 domain-containing protein [Candidatus Eisenbacteria bacterium]|nr:DUF4386 domain-containing protein [Candidatus Eisenbacteria bacterium]